MGRRGWGGYFLWLQEEGGGGRCTVCLEPRSYTAALGGRELATIAASLLASTLLPLAGLFLCPIVLSFIG